MCMPEPKLSGKPDAGNLPVRFDEGRGGRSSAPLLLSFDAFVPKPLTADHSLFFICVHLRPLASLLPPLVK
jgi:hypothetical protein